MTQALSPVLVAERVHARDFDGPNGRARGRVQNLDLGLAAGVHAVLGAPEDGTIALSEVVTGMRAPLRGRVLVRGRDPASSSALRARIGALAPSSDLPPAASVGELVRMAMRARGERDDSFDAILDPLGLSGLHARAPRTLSLAEARAVELALALSTPAALLVVLHEPLADVAIAHVGLVRERIGELARAGVCVLVVTSSPADARTLAERIHVLHHGAIVRGADGDGAGLVPGQGGELCAWIRDPEPPPEGAPDSRGSGLGGDTPHPRLGARQLAAALAERREVIAVSWEEARRPVQGGDNAHPGASVRVRGDDLEACARALAEVASETGVLIDAIACTAPQLTQVRAASELAQRSLANRGIGR